MKPGEILLLEVGYDEITLTCEYLVLTKNMEGPVFLLRTGRQIGCDGSYKGDARFFQLPPAREVK